MANSKDQILKRLGITEGVYSQIREFLRKNVDWTAFAGGYEGFTALPEENLANLKHLLVKKFPALNNKDEEIIWIIKRRYRNHQTIKKRKEKRAINTRTCCHSLTPPRSPASDDGDRKHDHRSDSLCSLREESARVLHHHVDLVDKIHVASIHYLLNPS